jgi:hypothetical protein
VKLGGDDVGGECLNKFGVEFEWVLEIELGCEAEFGILTTREAETFA